MADASKRSQMPSQLMPGSVFAGYRVESVIDRGGMAVVYKAVDLELGRVVALKIIAPEHSQNETAVARFKAECRLAASLEHPNIVAIHGGGEFDGVLYLAMRFVPGTNLREVIDRGPMELPRVARIIGYIASALDAAHERGLVHRDVKPANVLVSENGGRDQVYLTDFGLTKRLGSAGALTRTGSWVGTPDYVAPEQIQGHDVDRRADVYSLGCMLFEMLTGRVAYVKDSDMAKLWAHVTDPPPLPSTERPQLVGAFDDIVKRATAKKPADRFDTAGGLATAVEDAVKVQDETDRQRFAPTDLQPQFGAAATRDETFLRPEMEMSGDEPPMSHDPEPVGAGVGSSPPSGPSSASEGRHDPPPPPPPPRGVGATPPPGRSDAGTPGGGRGGGGRGGSGRGGGGGRGAGGGSGGWLGRHRVPVLAAVAAIVIAVVAFAVLGGSSSDNKKTKTAAAPAGQGVNGKLGPVPTNRVSGSGTATLRLDGRKLTVSIDTKSLLNGAPHALHIHAGRKGICPPASAAAPHNGHLSIATHAGVPYYGPAVEALTTKGDTSLDSLVAFNRYPTTSNVKYRRTVRVTPIVASYIRKNNAVLVVHGIDYNHNGVYDGVLERSDLDRSLTGESTAPALCGPLVAEKKAKSSTKSTAQLPSGPTVYSVALGTPPPTPIALLCHLGGPIDFESHPV